MKKVFFRGIEFLFTGTMTVIVLLLLFFSQVHFAAKKTFLLPNWAFALLGLGAALLLMLVWRRWHLEESQDSERRMDRAVGYVTLGLFVVQVYICWNILFASNWDPGIVWNAALPRAQGDVPGMEAVAHYFSIYPNNILLLLLNTGCYRLNHALGIFGESYSRMVPVLLDCASISAACHLVYKEISMLTKRQYALLGFACCVGLAGLSPWMVIFYSDSLAIVFPVLTLYLYTRACMKDAGKKRGIHKALALLICGVGYFIKPQCLIVVIAILTIELVKAIQMREKKAFTAFGALLAVPLLCIALIAPILTLAYESKGVPLDAEMKFGMTHFLMMGMNEECGGVYSDEDLYFSVAFATAKDRTAGELRETMARVRAMGPLGLGRHLCKKLLTVYHDGTFAWGMEGSWYTKVVENINTRMAPFLQSVYYVDGSRQEAFKTTVQALWIFVLLFTTVSGYLRLETKDAAAVNGIKLSIIGLTLFELLFEVRARYLFLYVPFFCILAALGLGAFQERLQKKGAGSPKT